MEARNRPLPDWLNRIKTRQITLPRFQRLIAWEHTQVSDLLTTVLRGLPAGSVLILNVGNEEQFESRTMTDAPEPLQKERVTEQLLDGQQRLTALWRSLNNTYTNRTYFVKFEDDIENSNEKKIIAQGQARWEKEGKKFPLWADKASECWKRGLIPVYLLCPDSDSDMVKKWIDEAIGDASQETENGKWELLDTVNKLQLKFREFNIPFLALPLETPKDIALDVFIKMNTSSIKLKAHDIVVALVENETGLSLREHEKMLSESVPRAKNYVDLSAFILDITALRQDRAPSQAGYKGLNYGKMIKDWNTIIKSIKGMIIFLEEECIFDNKRLPSYTALPVLAALWEHLPTQPDQLGNAKLLLRKFLWRAFLTSRYEYSTAGKALQDFRSIKEILIGGDSVNIPIANVPIFNEIEYPIITEELIILSTWPNARSIINRGLLALQMKCGAEDIADGKKASPEAIVRREYHHIFPKSLLSSAGLANEKIYLAINCMLITWRTNRMIGKKHPIDYLKERSERNDLGEDEIKRRLKTHLIPYKQFFSSEASKDYENTDEIIKLYESFIQERAKILAKAARLACDGEALNFEKLVGE